MKLPMYLQVKHKVKSKAKKKSAVNIIKDQIKKDPKVVKRQGMTKFNDIINDINCTLAFIS